MKLPKMSPARRAPALATEKQKQHVQRLKGEPLLPPPQDDDIARVSFLGLDEKAIAVPLADGTTRIVNRHCRWPCADPREVKPDQPLFCGDQRLTGLPYCKLHADRASNKVVVYRRPPRPKADKVPTFAELEKENA